MVIKIKSNVPYLLNLTGTYEVHNHQTIRGFLESLKVKWDEDALVILNQRISTGDELLHDFDQIELLVPISGG